MAHEAQGELRRSRATNGKRIMSARPSQDPTEPSSAAANEYSIDDLAAKSRVPSRTIRFYQSKQLLPKPTLRGRVAVYSDAHLERLKLVEELQDRGLHRG
jgi:MerR HTH family regulatory protein